MANKFTKSVLERQAKEARTHKAPPEQPPTPERANPVVVRQEPDMPAPGADAQPAASVSITPEGEGTPAPNAPVTEQAASQPPQEANADPIVEPAPAVPVKNTRRSSKPVEAAPGGLDLDAFIIHDEGRSAKNKTFYLDSAVIDAIHRAATARKVTDSKLVNDIMKKILGV